MNTMMVATNTLPTNYAAEITGNRPRRRTQGASLVEVLVVLAIIVGGLLLALQVFPVGFGQIKASGNRTLATQLAEQTMGQLQGDGANLPQGVLYKYFDPNGKLTSATKINPDDLAPCRYRAADGTLPLDPCTDENDTADSRPIVEYDVSERSYISDVNKFRFIEGEATKIPLPTPNAYGTGSIYACKFGPLLMDKTVGDPANVPDDASRSIYNDFLRISGAPLTGTVVQSSDNPRAVAGLLRSQQVYLIDYGSDGEGSGDEPIRIMFPPRRALNPARQNPSRAFKVTITYDAGAEGLKTVTVDVLVPDSDFPVWQTLPGNLSDGVAGSDTVSREFQRIARPLSGSPAWDRDDPYQYALLSDNIQTSATRVFANMGVITFNPSGGTYAEATANGTTRPFTAYIDYATLDWHILRDDREVPSALPGAGGTVPIRTTLGNIKGFGEALVDGTNYKGLYGVGSNTDPQDVQIFNLDAASGVPLVAGDYANGTPAPGGATGADYFIQRAGRGGTFGTGTIYINTARLGPGTHLRILYKARGDWAMSVQKAYARYTSVANPNDRQAFAPLPLRGNFNNYARNVSVADPQIRFPLSDLNKAFVVTLQYVTKDGEVRRVSPIQMVASERGRDEAEPDATNSFDRVYAFINVKNYLTGRDIADFATATRWDIVGPVSGVSLKTRVIWHDNDNTQNRWRVQDMDTFLTPDTL